MNSKKVILLNNLIASGGYIIRCKKKVQLIDFL